MRLGIIFLSFAFFIHCSGDRFSASHLSFELHLADTESGDGFTPMPLYNSDQTFFVADSVFLTSDDIASAEVIDWQSRPKVALTLKPAGAEKLARFTGRHTGEHAAMIVDNELLSAPRINAQITQGKLLIIGFFDHQAAVAIANGIVKTE